MARAAVVMAVSFGTGARVFRSTPRPLSIVPVHDCNTWAVGSVPRLHRIASTPNLPDQTVDQEDLMDADIGRDRYEVVEGFFRRPKGWTFTEGADVAVDSDDNVYVFCRGARPVMIFDRDGKFLDAWGGLGEPYFTFPHGITVGRDGFVYTADTRDHTIRKYTKNGKLVLTLGTPHQNTPPFSGIPFNRPSHATVASNGDIYVSDGHGNPRIHCFSQEGELKFSWGTYGDAPGEFKMVHSVFIDHDDNDTVYTTDRFNNRIQFFTPTGEFLGQWDGFDLPQSVRKGPDGSFFVAELAHRITIIDREGTVLARWGGNVRGDDSAVAAASTAFVTAPSRDPVVEGRVRTEPGAGLFCAPHGIAVDSQGSFYVAEASESWSGLDRGGRSVQKFVRS
jgi:DNA-binding beta-propeller fold protein YncE